ncbi:MAG TPA: hypothetical protein VI548_10620, partial [Chitinophagaceae bacterium]|nr:hypothetical protein [Chitinophagaceae bacterium]
MSATNTICRFIVSDFKDLKQKMLIWANQFSIFCFLDNHHYQIGPHSLECILAAGAKKVFKGEPGTALQELQKFINSKPGWLFGHLGYELNNETENITSSQKNRIQFPPAYFFEAEIMIRLSEKELIIESDGNAELIFRQLMETPVAVNAKREASS